MLRILERHPHSPEGAILRLAWLAGLSRSAITELRWDQVDFEGKAIQLPDRTVPLEPSTETCLRAVSYTHLSTPSILGVLLKTCLASVLL